MAAVSNTEATNLTTPSSDNNNGNDTNSNTTTTFSISPVTLQKLPHLKDYIPQQALKSQPNPLEHNQFYHPSQGFYISHSDIVLRHIVFDLSESFPSSASSVAYQRAGPRDRVFFDPSQTRAAIVTCGGLCPGLNTVIRELVVALWDLYGVRQIFGVKAGYRGFYSSEPVELNPKLVHSWHSRGGTVLETSRGGFDLQKIVDGIQDFNQVLFSDLCLNLIEESNAVN